MKMIELGITIPIYWNATLPYIVEGFVVIGGGGGGGGVVIPQPKLSLLF